MEYIHEDEQLSALIERLRGAELLAVDTEAAGYHRYHDRICLLQLSTRAETWIVDTLAVTNVPALSPILLDDHIEVVLHDADYDLRLMARDYGIRISNLFDTKTAAQLLGEPAIGLAGLVAKHLGVKLDKKHQRADWAQRPLPAPMIEYAAEDTRHLPQLRDRLREELVQKGRLAWAEEEFALRVNVDAASAQADPDAYMKLKNTRDLKPRQMAALRALHSWRERTAAERDVAPFRVMNNDVLVELARRLPENAEQMKGIAGLSDSVIARRGDVLLAAVQEARALADAELPTRRRGPGRPPPDPEHDALVDKLKAARDAAADRLQIDRGFLMPRQQLEDVARRRPLSGDQLLEVADMRRWQVEAMGEDLLEVIRATEKK